VSHGAGNWTNTKREIKLFLAFLKMSVARCGQPKKHDKEKANIFYFFDFFYFFVFFYNLKYFCILFLGKKFNNKRRIKVKKKIVGCMK